MIFEKIQLGILIHHNIYNETGKYESLILSRLKDRKIIVNSLSLTFKGGLLLIARYTEH